MPRKLFAGVALTAVVCFLLSRPILAHHGAAGYDMEKAVMMKATITDFEWGNPHSQIFFDVTDDKGKVSHWVAETEPPAVMMERGWARKSLKSGDQVTVYAFIAKNGATTSILQKIVLADGKELTARGGGAN
jgi:Family of unknown function (DUF6152)